MIGVVPTSGPSPSAAFSRRRCDSFCASTWTFCVLGLRQYSSLSMKPSSAFARGLAGTRGCLTLRRVQGELRHQRLLSRLPLALLLRASRAGPGRAQVIIRRHRQRRASRDRVFVRRVACQAKRPRKVGCGAARRCYHRVPKN
jgi:hypothetical protein